MYKTFNVTFTLILNGDELLLNVQGSVEPAEPGVGLMSESLDIEAIYDVETGELRPFVLFSEAEKTAIEKAVWFELQRK